MSAYLVPKASDEIQTKFVEFLNDYMTDPYEQATNKKRATFVYGDDFKLVAIFPKIHVSLADFTPTKISTQSKTTYLEEEEHHFMIYYYNQRGHRFTFDNGSTLIDEAQCRKFLQEIRNKVKANADYFDDYCHNITFGTIPKPIVNLATSTFFSVLPIVVYTYKR